MTNLDEKLKDHQQFAAESRRRINKAMAQNDPLYSHRYHEKRDLILVQIQTKAHEVNCLTEKLERYNKQLESLKEELKKLDGDFKNYEPM